MSSASGQSGTGPSRRGFIGAVGGAAALSSIPVLLSPGTAAAATVAKAGPALEPTADATLTSESRNFLSPTAVTSVQGNVENAGALINGGTATLTAKAGGTAPLVVLDYDQIVGGQPVFLVSRVSGDVTLQAIYSQSLPYLLPGGDGFGTNNNAGERTISFVGVPGGAQLSRVENYQVTGPGPVIGHLLQAGQRFQAITLLGSGSVQISRVGFRPSFRLDTPDDPWAGAFTCSDQSLNKIWQIGVHTVNACSVPVGSVPSLYEATRDGLVIYGCEYTAYRPGGGIRQEPQLPAVQQVRGMYSASTTQPSVFDEIGNGFALLYGLPALDPSIDVATLAASLTKALAGPKGPCESSSAVPSGNIAPYETGWEVLGRLATGQSQGALDLIRQVWGLMLPENTPYYSGGCWEYVTQTGLPGLGPGTSLAHGWSSGATPALSMYVLGGRPLTPGYKTFLVEPQPGDLSWAGGRVPTPKGPVTINWTAHTHGASGFTLKVQVPGGTRGYAGVPSTAARGRVDGTSTAPVTVPGYGGLDKYLYFGPLTPGNHTITVA